MLRSGGHEARGNAAGATACAGRVSQYTHDRYDWQLLASRMLAARQPSGSNSRTGSAMSFSGMKSLPDMVGLLLLLFLFLLSNR